MPELLVCGGGLAGLIAAVLHARQGGAVTLFNDGRPLGGHFAGLQLDGLDFDIGMVMFEQHRPAFPCDRLADYQPARRNDWTRFGHLAADWLQAQLALRRVPTPCCRVNGRVWPDYLISNRLEALVGAGLTGPGPLPRNDPRHAGNKLLAGPFDALNYAEAASLNHGVEVHDRFIEPFVRKLGAQGSEAFLARQHRAAWAPLYHPEAITQVLSGTPSALVEYPFWTSDSGCVSTWVRSLQTELAAARGVTLVSSPLSGLRSFRAGWAVETLDGHSRQAPHCVLAMPPERACGLLGVRVEPAPPGISVAVAMCSVEAPLAANGHGCLMVVDDEFLSYRLTSPDLLAGLDGPRCRVVVEFNPERLAQRFPGADPVEHAVRELRSLWSLSPEAAVRVHKLLVARHALVLPTRSSLDGAVRCHAALHEAAPGAWLTGPLLGYGVASLNDQIVQALQITEALAA